MLHPNEDSFLGRLYVWRVVGNQGTLAVDERRLKIGIVS